MINKAILVGNVGSEPEIKVSQKEKEFAGFSLATSEKYKQGDEMKTVTQWHRVVVFDPNLVKHIKSWVKKGTKLYIEGQINTRSYDKDGEKRYLTEIVLGQYKGIMRILDSKGGTSGSKDNQVSKSEESEDILF